MIFADDVIAHFENPKKSTKKAPRTDTSSAKSQDTQYIQKINSISMYYNEKVDIDIKGTITFFKE